MPTPREPNLVDRLLEFGLGKPSRRERVLLIEARPPKWIRMVFGIALGMLGVAFVIALVGEFVALPWAPRIWPAWSLVAVSIFAVRFIQREIYRQYGKRAWRGQRDWE